jgi:hypothetical protein
LDKYHCRGSPTHLNFLRSCNRFTSLYPTAAAFRHGTSWLSTTPEGSKADEKWRGDVPLQNYRAQFEEEFGSGRKLTTSSEAATDTNESEHKKGALPTFVKNEIDMLEELLGILTGKRTAERLDFLLDELDYLWAHFPDCAGGGGRRPPSSDIAFLKRVRAEIEPCLTLWRRTLGTC